MSKIDAQINELSEILLQELANRPELLAKIKTHKGAADKKAVPGKRLTMRDHKNYYRQLFTNLNACQQ